jgi:hypothetical protein
LKRTRELCFRQRDSGAVRNQKIRFKKNSRFHRFSFDSSSVSFKAGVVYGLSILHHHQVSAVQMGIRQIQAVQLSTMPVTVCIACGADQFGGARLDRENRSLRTCAGCGTSETVPARSGHFSAML